MSKYSTEEKCRFAALYYLGVRMLTTHELREKLVKKEYPKNVIDETVAYVTEIGYLNDKD